MIRIFTSKNRLHLMNLSVSHLSRLRFRNIFLVLLIIISYHFSFAQQDFVNFDTAKLVIGQPDFTTNIYDTTQAIAIDARASAISNKGVLAVGSQDGQRVLLWNSVPSENGIPADVVIGQIDFESVSQAASASLLGRVSAVAFSPDGKKLLVVDEKYHRVMIWNTIPTTNGQPADLVIGQTTPGTVPADPLFPVPTPTSTTFYSPTGILVTPGGKLIISDFRNNRVLIFNKIPTSNNAAANVVIGQTNFTTSASGTSATKLFRPYSTSLSPDGKLVISDQSNNRVLVYNSVPTTNGAAADVVIGQSNVTTGTSGTSAATLKTPTGVTVSPSGQLAIGDFNNNRVVIFNTIPTSNGDAADIVLGQPDFLSDESFNDGQGNSGSPSAQNMLTPYGINFDLNGRLFVNGRDMNRVMVFGTLPEEEAELSLSFELGESGSCANIAEPVTYSLIITNNGPDPATNVIANSALPSGFTLTTSEINIGTYNSSSGFWTIPALANNESATLTLTGTIEEGQANNTITSYANIQSSDQADNDLSNNSSTLEVKVSTNTPPTITSIENQTILENASTNVLNFVIEDADNTINELTVTATSSNTNLVPNNNIILGGSDANGTIQVTPMPDKAGVSYITINVSDGECQKSRTFRLTVELTNEIPTISEIEDQIINENEVFGPVTFTINDTETASESLTITAVSDSQLLVPDANIILGGSNAERTIKVTPVSEQFGTTIISVIVSDGVKQATESFTLTVTEINSTPIISSIADLSILENTATDALSFTISDTETAAIDLVVSAESNNEILVPNENISLSGSGEDRAVTITPVADEVGSALITITVSDGIKSAQETFTLTVVAGNTPPVISIIEDKIIEENTSTNAIAFTIDDSETDAADLQVTATSNNLDLVPNANIALGGSSTNRTITITPIEEAFGTTTITVTVSDGIDEATETFLLTVTEINDSPFISVIDNQEILVNTSSDPINFTISDTETSVEELMVSVTSDDQALLPDENITLAGSGEARTIILTPSADETGATLITISVSDGVNQSMETFTLTVSPVNTPPSISSIEDLEVDQDNMSNPISFTVNDNETPASQLIVTASSDNQTLVPDANVSLLGSDGNRTITITPAANEFGSATITLTVSDGSLSSETSFMITVNQVTGVYDREFDNSIILFPNPTQRYTHLTINNEYEGPIAVSILSASGHLIQQLSLSKNKKSFKVELDVLKISTGSYFIKIESDKFFSVKRLIKE